MRRRQRLADRSATIAAGARLRPSSRVPTVRPIPRPEVVPLSTAEQQTTRLSDADRESPSAVKVSVVIPCLNEAASIERCVGARPRGARGPGLARAR